MDLNRSEFLRGTLLGWKKAKAESKRAYSNVSYQQLTRAIINTDLWFKRQGLCILIRSLNLWDLALNKKRKAKPKGLA